MNNTESAANIIIKFFNMYSIFDNTHMYLLPLDRDHWLGKKSFEHILDVQKLGPDFQSAGRIYVEYEMGAYKSVTDETCSTGTNIDTCS